MSFSIEWENKIYGQSKQLNKYPYGEFVSVFFNSLQYLDKELETRKDVKILELGCGAGNNVKFMAEQQFDVYGIDGSASACKATEGFLKEHGLSATIVNSLFKSLPFEDEYFDMVIDREAMYCGTISDIIQSWKEAARTLKKGGMVISFTYTDANLICQEARDGKFAVEVEENTFTDFTDGFLKDTGIAHFTSYDELSEIFDFLDIKYINRHTNNTVYSETKKDAVSYEEWIVVGIKK